MSWSDESWSDETMTLLRRWLSSPKWYPGGPNDDPKFYDFIAAVWGDKQGPWDEQWAREKITATATDLHPQDEHGVSQAVDRAMSEGTLILEFLSRMKEQGRSLG